MHVSRQMCFSIKRAIYSLMFSTITVQNTRLLYATISNPTRKIYKNLSLENDAWCIETSIDNTFTLCVL